LQTHPNVPDSIRRTRLNCAPPAKMRIADAGAA
jgi:hypothetical protein